MLLNLYNLRNPKFYLMVLLDLALFSAALLGAYLLRFEFRLTPQYWNQYWEMLKYVLPLKLGLFIVFGMYRGMWRYTGLGDSYRLLEVTALQSLALVALVALRFRFLGFPRSVYILDWMLTLFLTAGLRVGIRTIFGWLDAGRSVREAPARAQRRQTVLLVGAGRAGEHILREIKQDPGLGLRVAGVLDDDPSLRGRTIHGVSVLGGLDRLSRTVKRRQVDEVIIALPSATPQEMRRIVEACEAVRVRSRTLPAMSEILDGKVTVQALRDVNYADLLGRSEVRLDTEGLSRCLTGRTVLVTGCGGSIGSELCRQIVRFAPAKLVLLDAGEYNLYHIQMELHWELHFRDYVTALGSVTDAALLERVFAEHAPDIVFHAAAYKHVPMLERSPWQAVENNIRGTAALMEAAHRHEAGRFVIVSTDKAVRPTNVMGASKRVTELLMERYRGGKTAFMAVRFGNVLGSSGSVVPLFRGQIEHGGPVTVTHPEVTRYFMSIAEASQLILQAGAMARGGETFILDMGVPVRIADMAADLIRMSGKEPGRDIEIVYTGLREGEKLYEELITEGEDVVRTEHEKILVLAATNGPSLDPALLESGLVRLAEAAAGHDEKAIREVLRELVPEYVPAS